MGIVIKIAFRNVILNKKRSFLIGFAVFISSLVLLATNATMNGVVAQVVKSYTFVQAGQVVVMWKKQQEVNNMDAAKFLQDSETFDPKNDGENKKMIDMLNVFLNENKSDIKAYFPMYRRFMQYSCPANDESGVIVYSVTPEGWDFISQAGVIKIVEGEMLPDEDMSICISSEKAKADNLKIGDKVSFDLDPTGQNSNILRFTVRGIYANGAGYDNSYGFVSDKDARKLVGLSRDSKYFDIVRIFLKDEKKIPEFSDKLDNYLTAQSDVLRAETFSNASAFFTSTFESIRAFYNIFVYFMLLMIAIGLNTAIRMNLFERMKEFGTLRAIGYSRFKNFTIVFLEVFFLSTMALFVAIGAVLLFVGIYGKTGIYVGPGEVSYALGGESFYPNLKFFDVLFAFIVIIIFSTLSTVSPGLKLCYQNITDVLAKRQKKINIPLAMLRSIFLRK